MPAPPSPPRPGRLGADLPTRAPTAPRSRPAPQPQLCEPRVRGPRRRRLLERSQNKQPKATSPGGNFHNNGRPPVAAGSGFLGQHNPTSLMGEGAGRIQDLGLSRAQLRIAPDGMRGEASPAEAQQLPVPLRDHSPDSSAHHSWT